MRTLHTPYAKCQLLGNLVALKPRYLLKRCVCMCNKIFEENEYFFNLNKLVLGD